MVNDVRAIRPAHCSDGKIIKEERESKKAPSNRSYSPLRSPGHIELLEEEHQLPECAEQVACAWVVAQFALCYHEAGVDRPEVFDPFGGGVHC